MILSQRYQAFKPKITMAALAVTLLLALPSSARPDTINESVEPQTIQLRGGSRSLSVVASDSTRSDSERLPVDNKPTLPVSPGVADGVDPDDLPCLVQTICDQPELSILCGLITTHLEDWNSTRGMDNVFVGEGEGTFFAPLDEAFEDNTGIITDFILSDLGNPGKADNLISQHFLEIDETQNVTDLLLSLEDLECNEELMMANRFEANTLCFGAETILVGSGNRNLRTLPSIIEGDIETCNGTVAIHYVNELIIPPLPFKEMPAYLVDDSLASRLSEECPLSANFGSCERFEPGLQCNYDYSYVGCTWETLECRAIMRCECDKFRGGYWACLAEARMACENRLEGFPMGYCDPNLPLPQPVTAEESSISSNPDREEEVVLSLMAGDVP